MIIVISLNLYSWKAFILDNGPTSVIQNWVCDIHFLENERSEPVISGKQLAVFIANDKIQAFGWK